MCLFRFNQSHRFYVKKTETGLLMLITLGLLGIWVLTGKFKDENDLRIESYVDKT